ncbi:MAG: hypothetical protein AAGD01_05145 [Acidobacteriota bacterium]
MKRMIKTAVVALALLALLSIGPLASASPPPFIGGDGATCTWVLDIDGPTGPIGIYACSGGPGPDYFATGPSCKS